MLQKVITCHKNTKKNTKYEKVAKSHTKLQKVTQCQTKVTKSYKTSQWKFTKSYKKKYEKSHKCLILVTFCNLLHFNSAQN